MSILGGYVKNILIKMFGVYWFRALNGVPRFCSLFHFVISAEWLHFSLLSSLSCLNGLREQSLRASREKRGSQCHSSHCPP